MEVEAKQGARNCGGPAQVTSTPGAYGKTFGNRFHDAGIELVKASKSVLRVAIAAPLSLIPAAIPVQSISISIRECKRKSEEGRRKCALPGCPPIRRAEFGPALRCLPQVMSVQLLDAHAVGHTSTGGAPGWRPWRGGRLDIMGGGRRSAEREVRKDASPCSARFRGGAGCGRRHAGLETMRMRAPQAQSRGSTSRIFLSRRAQVLRASLEKSELSCWARTFAAGPALSPWAEETAIPARLE
jgi:hypothetical protein